MPGVVIRTRLADQRAMVLPATMWVLFIMTLFGATAASSAIWASSQTKTDVQTKRAVAAADAAIDIAVERLNSRQVSDAACPPADPSAPLQAPDATGWCPVVKEYQEGTASSDPSQRIETYYRVSRGEGQNLGGCSSGITTRKVVGVGRAGNRTKAIATTINSLGGPTFPCAVVAMDDIIMRDQGRIDGDVSTNGRLRAAQSNNSQMCGNWTAAVNQYHQPIVSRWDCNGTRYDFNQLPVGEGFARAALDPPATYDGNARITSAKAGCGTGPCDTIIGNPADVVWDPAGRSLKLKNSVELDLRGANYGLCSLRVEDDAKLKIASSQQVRLYMDAARTNPGSSCAPDSDPLTLANRGTIDNPGQPTMLAIIGLGNVGLDPGQNDGDCTNPPTMRFRETDETPVTINAVVHGPAWCVRLAGGVKLSGSVITKKLFVFRNAALEWNQDALRFGSPAPASYIRLNDWHTCPTPTTLTAFDTTGCDRDYPQ